MSRKLYLLTVVSLLLVVFIAWTTTNLAQEIIGSDDPIPTPATSESPASSQSYRIFLPGIAMANSAQSSAEPLAYPPFAWSGVPTTALLSPQEIRQQQPPPQDTSTLDSQLKSELAKIESAATAKGINLQAVPTDKLDVTIALGKSLTQNQRQSIGEAFARHEPALKTLMASIETTLNSKGKVKGALSVETRPDVGEALSLDMARTIETGLADWQTSLDADMRTVLTEEQWIQYQSSLLKAPQLNVNSADMSALGLPVPDSRQKLSSADASANAYYAYLYSYYANAYQYYSYLYAYYGYYYSYCWGSDYSWYAMEYDYYAYYYGYFAFVYDYYSYAYWPNSTYAYYGYVYAYYGYVYTWYGYVYSYYSYYYCWDYYGYLYVSYYFNYYAEYYAFYAYYFSYYAYEDVQQVAAIDYHTRDGFYVFKIDLRSNVSFETVMANDATSGLPENRESVSSMASKYSDKGRNPILAFNADYFGAGHGAQGLIVKNGTRFPNAGSHNGDEWKKSSLSISSANNLRIGIQTDCQGPPDNACTDWVPDSSSYYNTVGGGPLFVKDGQRIGGADVDSIEPCDNEDFEYRYCNGTFNWTAVGVSKDGNYLIVVVSDTDKSMDQAAAVLIAEGADRAIKMDSGSSTQVWYKPAGDLVPAGGVANALMVFSSQ